MCDILIPKYSLYSKIIVSTLSRFAYIYTAYIYKLKHVYIYADLDKVETIILEWRKYKTFECLYMSNFRKNYTR
jgi:hypothetical protein